MNIIAECKLPKQRMTRQFGYLMRQNEDGYYSVHRIYYDNGELGDGYCDLSFDAAMERFKERVEYMFSFGTTVYEIAEKDKENGK